MHVCVQVCACDYMMPKDHKFKNVRWKQITFSWINEDKYQKENWKEKCGFTGKSWTKELLILTMCIYQFDLSTHWHMHTQTHRRTNTNIHTHTPWKFSIALRINVKILKWPTGPCLAHSLTPCLPACTLSSSHTGPLSVFWASKAWCCSSIWNVSGSALTSRLTYPLAEWVKEPRAKNTFRST